MLRKIVFAVVMCTLASTISRAEVADSGAGGFTIKITTSIHGAPADVYKRLVHNIGDWWSSQHTFSGDAHNLSIEERPMGCFCERLANGGVRHMEVVFFSPGKRLVLSGGLGPLQGIGAAGAMTFDLTADKTAQSSSLLMRLPAIFPRE